MFFILKVFLLLLVVQHADTAATPLYDNFITAPITSLSTAYTAVKYYPSWTKNLLKFYGNDTSIDFTTRSWMEPCYQEFYNAKNATYVIFWLKDDIVSCEAGSSVLFAKTPTYTADYLMRVEQLGDRCTETM
ncbi:unnamed protein product [Caenorhabditis brenneri]